MQSTEKLQFTQHVILRTTRAITRTTTGTTNTNNNNNSINPRKLYLNEKLIDNKGNSREDRENKILTVKDMKRFLQQQEQTGDQDYEHQRWDNLSSLMFTSVLSRLLLRFYLLFIYLFI